MEKGNDAGTGGAQVMQADPGSGATAGATPGGGNQADQEMDEIPGIPTGEIIHPDGSRLSFTEDGGATFTDPSGKTGVWDSEYGWVDPVTGESLPDDFGDPGTGLINSATERTLSDWQDRASRMMDAAGAARAHGRPDVAERYQRKYEEAVRKSTELGGQEPRR